MIDSRVEFCLECKEKNCILIPPDDPSSIANAVARLMASPELRVNIGASARELAQHFTWDKIARQHVELYERMTNKIA